MPRWSRDKNETSTTVQSTPTPDSDELDIEIELEESEESEETDNVGAQFIAPGEAAGTTKRPLYPQDNPWLTVTEEETGTKPPLLSRLWQSHVRGPEKTDVGAQFVAPDAEATAGDVPAISSENGDALVDIQPAVQPETPVNAPLVPGAPTVPREGRKLPPLRVVGQLSQSYIVTEGPDGMYLIDQHAAHERILLERMVAALQARTPISQMLLTPIKVELSPIELEAVEEHLAQLEQIGFTLETIDKGAVQVKAVPNVLLKQMNARSLHDLLADLIATENQGHTGHTGTWEEHALANVACKAAIKANYFLTVSEMREMIEQLEHTNAPYSCCHGRPTMVQFSLSALEREFGRR
jgi:DNA mismatch repair protein MutL